MKLNNLKKILKVENEVEFLKEIVKKIEEKRPENRRGKNIDLQTSIELLLDYTFSFRTLKPEIEGYSQITVEIKPKSFLFDDVSEEELTTILNKKRNIKDLEVISSKYKKYFSKESYLLSDEKIKFTKFHKVQLKKSAEHSVKNFSKYDPHDLFSCQKEGIKKSIFDLYQTPQNNLRVFLDSHPISEDQICNLEKILHKFFNDENILNKFADLITEALYSSKLLDTIKDFQNLYPGTGLKLRNIITKLENSEYKSQTENIYDYVIQNVNGAIGKEHSYDLEENLENFVTEVVKFLLSIAFRDCSMLISFHFASKDSSSEINNFFLQNGFNLINSKDFSEEVFYKTGFIDFQMKSFDHLNKYLENLEDLFCLYWDSIEQSS